MRARINVEGPPFRSIDDAMERAGAALRELAGELGGSLQGYAVGTDHHTGVRVVRGVLTFGKGKDRWTNTTTVFAAEPPPNRRQLEALCEIGEGRNPRRRGRNAGGAIARMLERLEARKLITSSHMGERRWLLTEKGKAALEAADSKNRRDQ